MYEGESHEGWRLSNVKQLTVRLFVRLMYTWGKGVYGMDHEFEKKIAAECTLSRLYGDLG